MKLIPAMLLAGACMVAAPSSVFAQASATAPAGTPAGAPPAPASPAAASTAAVTPPADYVIGPEDVLTVVFWRERDLTTEVTVRPDGRISIPVIQDITAAGLTPEELRDQLTKQAERYVEDPNVTVIVKQINSRRVFITGQVTKPGPYDLTAPLTIVQLIAMAGGLLEYADSKKIVVVRMEKGQPVSYRFNFNDVANRRNLRQNILLKPGDTVIVP